MMSELEIIVILESPVEVRDLKSLERPLILGTSHCGSILILYFVNVTSITSSFEGSKIQTLYILIPASLSEYRIKQSVPFTRVGLITNVLKLARLSFVCFFTASIICSSCFCSLGLPQPTMVKLKRANAKKRNSFVKFISRR